jgi:hypothetical protein
MEFAWAKRKMYRYMDTYIDMDFAHAVDYAFGGWHSGDR